MRRGWRRDGAYEKLQRSAHRETTMTEGRRGKRIAEDIRAHLASALVVECSDPRLAQLVVTRVSLSADLGIADISVRSLSVTSERDRQSTMRALSAAAGRLRRVIGERLHMKRTPTLRFHYDEDPENRGRVEALLKEIRALEQAPADVETAETPHEPTQAASEEDG